MNEDIRCWRCGAERHDCCCGDFSPITFEDAIDTLNDLHLKGKLEDFPQLYPNKDGDELDFDGG